jgi:hypothetical protein
MSNRLDWIHDPSEMKASKASSENQRGLRKKVLNIPVVKRVLLGFYDRVFRWYFES